MDFEHKPVLLEACLTGLNIKPTGTYLDGTVGGAGHSVEIAKRLTTGKLLCTDKDREAVAVASERLRQYHAVTVIKSDYKDVRLLAGIEDNTLDGVLLDLGVSSYQLDNADRGFSYSKDGALDMRMSGDGESAADLVNNLTWQQLADIIRMYGEEQYAAAIARKIVAERQLRPITTTSALSEIVVSAVPASVRRKSKHPATKTFQALRIAVNDELEVLREGLQDIFELLAPGGRFCVITFHSLEDRIVKQFFASLQVGCTCPPDFPQCVCNHKERARAITKKPIIASQEECESNRRSRSAKLRIIEKTGD